jgi:hypothetical protein
MSADPLAFRPTGAAGIALALADHAELPAPDVPARWDAILLLSRLPTDPRQRVPSIF